MSMGATAGTKATIEKDAGGRNGGRIGWIDLAKGMAILLVVIGHSMAPGSAANNYIYSFHMPLFFALSGYTFRPKPWRELVVSSAKRLLVPYALMFFAWHVITTLMYYPAVTPQICLNLALTFVFGSGAQALPFGIGGVGTSWFLVTLFSARILLNAVCTLAGRACGDPGRARILEGALCLALYAAGVWLGAGAQLYLPVGLDTGMVAVFFMWCGRAARELRVERAFRPGIAAAAFVVWGVGTKFSELGIADRIYQNPWVLAPTALLGSFVTCAVADALMRHAETPLLRPAERLLMYSGKNSMGVFCANVLDWWVPWQTMPALAALPHFHYVVALVRCAYDLALVRLAQKTVVGRA